MPITVIKEGTPFYSGKHASVPERARRDIKLFTEWTMLALCPDDSNKAIPAATSEQPMLSSAERNFLSQPARGGGVTTFATI